METNRENDRIDQNPENQPLQPFNNTAIQPASPWEINRLMFQRFFNFTGGSIFYCISAVLVAYGVAR